MSKTYLCPMCGDGMRTIDSRALGRHNGVRRRRECNACKHRVTTHETHSNPAENELRALKIEVKNTVEALLLITKNKH